MVSARLHAATTGATTAAGEAADDDVEEGDNSVDDCGAGSADGVDDGHEHIADGAEDGLDLYMGVRDVCGGERVCGKSIHKRLRRPW